MKTLAILAAATLLNTSAEFPHDIHYELGASGFSEGDKITITAVHGDRRHIEPGGSYLVEGTYTLNSADSADLSFFCTTRGPSGPTPVQDWQHVKVTRGSGHFRLYETNVPDGWLHVSFYRKGWHSEGVYFGEKGEENTIMRDRSWFQNVSDKLLESHSSSEANQSLMAFLGDPVPRPAGMNPQYDKDGLMKAFTSMCENGRLVITKLEVDDSEFPFLLYGTIEGKHTLPHSLFDDQKGYTYGGSVRGSADDRATYFAINIVPEDQYPEGLERACHRRLMVRLQMLADRAEQTISQ